MFLPPRAFRCCLWSLLLAAGACSPQLAPDPVCKASAAASAATLAEVNAYRRSRGLNTLAAHPGLELIAQGHSRALLERHHKSTRKTLVVDHAGCSRRIRAARELCGMNGFGENVAGVTSRPPSLPAHLKLLWQSSPAHHRIMLGDYTHTGVAIAVDEDGTAFATQIFGKADQDPP